MSDDGSEMLIHVERYVSEPLYVHLLITIMDHIGLAANSVYTVFSKAWLDNLQLQSGCTCQIRSVFYSK